ncbi:MAG: indolepyruvate ferredoxin oxidoreductase family protein, partial [Alphaproteobacteria bacterium]|nr:indolepyruvate ferredoxin oxidoreductase family protein [Alphaproteobacteria bacterium]
MKPSLLKVDLDDKYTLDSGRIFITGMQALVRLPLMQKRRDDALGLTTAGFISGYRGSPLGGFDVALWKASTHLKNHQIHFQPGINEDLGATAVWGSQQIALSPGARVQGVFSMWYGKGPGVDRSGDALKHANMAGTNPYGGVLALVGDDHACKSSTLPHQSDYALMDAFIPIIHPATVQDVLDLGLMGWALSRYSGLWVGFKMLSDNVDTAASVVVDPDRFSVHIPHDFEMPKDGLHLRWPDTPLEQERRLHNYKLKSVPYFVRANHLNRVVWPGKSLKKQTRFGIIAVGKAYLEVRQALKDLGLDEAAAKELGLALFKVTVSWPLEPQGIQNFCKGLESVLIIEEKRPLIENQVKEILYHFPAEGRPKIYGKTDPNGKPLLPSSFELNTTLIAATLASCLESLEGFERFQKVFQEALKKAHAKSSPQDHLTRLPYYCSGCPHNTSTRQVPEGSRAMAGIGCHYMATWIAPHHTKTFTQMGAEGVPWIGQAPFTSEKHIFANLGDGTYYHSGILAIRSAIAAKVNITYKILYNDAVAMTGGQSVDGPLTVWDVSRQVYAEGVRRIAVVSEDLNRYPLGASFAPGTTLHMRDELASVQENLKNWKGTSVIIYDQTCAIEKRRRRKRGTMEDPNKRIFINETVCEGCGDCGKKSNCLSVIPQETEWGLKRTIDQSSCNKDFSCIKGLCPSFVSVVGGKIRKPVTANVPEDFFAKLPQPKPLALKQPYSIFVAGIGGTGVVTIGSLIGMAAHLEGKGCAVVDMAGLAQKGGAVVSHIHLSKSPEDITATRINSGGADLLFGSDLVVSAASDSLDKIHKGHTQVVLNTYESITGHFTQDPDFEFPASTMKEDLIKAAGKNKIDSINATALAKILMGDSITANLFMVGYALQKEYIPLSPRAIEEAIRLNDVAILLNTRAFNWGRLAAVDFKMVEEFAKNEMPLESDHVLSQTLMEKIQRRYAFLVNYQDKAYANRYLTLVQKVEEEEKRLGLTGLTEAVAQTYYRLLAVKDEYEVARLYTNGDFMRRLHQQFDGDFKVQFHLAPPLFARRDPHTGELKKATYGSWVMKVFKVLAKAKRVRGTIFDIFGYTKERRMERQMLIDFEIAIGKLLVRLTPKNHIIACQIAALPQSVRGYGHVKYRNLKACHEAEEKLWAQ